MKHILLSFLISLVLSTSAKAQDACLAASDMNRLFSTLHYHVMHDSTPEDPQLRILSATASRYSPPSIDYIFRQSSIANLTASITSGFVRAEEIIVSLSVTPNNSQPIYRPDTAFTLNRALSSLTHLDCSNRNRETNQPDSETNTSNKIDENLAFGQIDIPQWLISGILSVVALSTLVFGYLLMAILQARATSLTRRYTCHIHVQFNTLETPNKVSISIAKDISRSGVKIAAINDTCPPLNSKLTIKLGIIEKKLNIRWGNAHYFGGEFDKAITTQEFTKLLGPGQKWKVRKKPKPQLK